MHKLTNVELGASTWLLASARDWQLKVDPGKQLKFPKHITRTTLGPDLVLTSDCSKQVVVLELAVPWEHQIEEPRWHKRAKYLELPEECRGHGWKACCWGLARQSIDRTEEEEKKEEPPRTVDLLGH